MRISDWSSDVCSSDLSAIRIPDVEHRCLCEHIGAAETRGVLRIAFDLGRSAFMTFDQNAVGVAVDTDGAGVKLRLADTELLGSHAHRHDRFCRWTTTRGDTAECHRGRGIAQEIASVDRKSTRLNSSHYCAPRM